jgi:hypothetical protein
VETAEYISKTLGQSTVQFKTRSEGGKKGSPFNGVMTVLGLQQEARTFSYDDEKTAPLPLDEERADLLAAFLQSAYDQRNQLK